MPKCEPWHDGRRGPHSQRCVTRYAGGRSHAARPRPRARCAVVLRPLHERERDDVPHQRNEAPAVAAALRPVCAAASWHAGVHGRAGRRVAQVHYRPCQATEDLRPRQPLGPDCEADTRAGRRAAVHDGQGPHDTERRHVAHHVPLPARRPQPRSVLAHPRAAVHPVNLRKVSAAHPKST